MDQQLFDFLFKKSANILCPSLIFFKHNKTPAKKEKREY